MNLSDNELDIDSQLIKFKERILASRK